MTSLRSEGLRLVAKWRRERIEVPPAPNGGSAKSYNCALTACANELEAALETDTGDVRDAERYRWLRDVANPYNEDPCVTRNGVLLEEAEIDAAIDAALAAQKEPK